MEAGMLESATFNSCKEELYLSRLACHTTVSTIENYMRQRGIELNNVCVTSLFPKNRELSTLSFISFKIDTTTDTAKILKESSFWPAGCLIKDFVRKAPKIANLSKSPFDYKNVNFFQKPPRHREEI